MVGDFDIHNFKHYQIWQDFKESAREHGLDICYLILSLCQAWLSGVEGTKQMSFQIATPTQVINLQQQNTFVYNVRKPRREPLTLNCPRKNYSRTIRSLAFQAYVTEKARDLKRSFSFYDFPELGHDFFRKCIFRLKNRQKILPLQPRTNPRFYILTDWRPNYPTMFKNTVVKPRFTGGS